MCKTFILRAWDNSCARTLRHPRQLWLLCKSSAMVRVIWRPWQIDWRRRTCKYNFDKFNFKFHMHCWIFSSFFSSNLIEKHPYFKPKKQWNDIPLDIKLSGSVDVFKSRLKTYLFRLAFIWLFVLVLLLVSYFLFWL